MNTWGWGIGCFPRKYRVKVPFLLQLCIAHVQCVYIIVNIDVPLMFIPYILRFWQAYLPLMFPWCPSLYPYLSRWFTYFSKALASLPSWNSRITVLTNRLGGLVLAWITWLEQQIGACGWILVLKHLFKPISGSCGVYDEGWLRHEGKVAPTWPSGRGFKLRKQPLRQGRVHPTLL